jgi:hypothetical protein
MKKLLIQKREGRYIVTHNDNAAFECCNLAEALEHSFYPVEFGYRAEAHRLLSSLFRILRAEQVGVGGEGDWWIAEAEVMRDRPRYITDVESDHPLEALRALIVEIVKEDFRLDE